MKGRGSRGVRGVRRSRSRRGGAGGRLLDELLGGGKRTFRKRTCRSKSRCGGAAAANYRKVSLALGGSRGVRGVGRSRRGGYEILPAGLGDFHFRAS